MSHWLPDIDVAIDVDTRRFVERLIALARAGGNFEAEPHENVGGVEGFDVANFAPVSLRFGLDQRAGCFDPSGWLQPLPF